MLTYYPQGQGAALRQQQDASPSGGRRLRTRTRRPKWERGIKTIRQTSHLPRTRPSRLELQGQRGDSRSAVRPKTRVCWPKSLDKISPSNQGGGQWVSSDDMTLPTSHLPTANTTPYHQPRVPIATDRETNSILRQGTNKNRSIIQPTPPHLRFRLRFSRRLRPSWTKEPNGSDCNRKNGE